MEDEALWADVRGRATESVGGLFALEDPARIEVAKDALGQWVDASLFGAPVRGRIDRTTEAATWTVTDYKTGAVPSVQHERKRLSGVHVYSLLTEALLGVRPRRIQLLYLSQPLAISTEPSDQTTRGTRRTMGAIWQAVERACEREDFRPRQSRLCNYCAYQNYCPVFGGDPDKARQLATAPA